MKTRLNALRQEDRRNPGRRHAIALFLAMTLGRILGTAITSIFAGRGFRRNLAALASQLFEAFADDLEIVSGTRTFHCSSSRPWASIDKFYRM
jgi:hypothetical protein